MKSKRKALSSLIVAVLILALLAIGIPSFFKARNTSSQNACINNLRMIDAGREQWEERLSGKATNVMISVSEEDIVGTWETRGELFAKGIITYRADGTWQAGIKLFIPEEPVQDIEGKGSWSIEGNRLLYETTWISDTNYPLYSGGDVIVSVTEDRFDYRPRGRDEVKSRYRVK